MSGRPPGRPPPVGPARGGTAAAHPRLAAAERVVGLLPWAVGAAAGVLALGPALGSGFVLSYDMVAVPDPPLSEVTLGGGGGFPRAVPSDAVLGAVGLLLPGDLAQALLLMAVFTLAGAGAGRIVPAGPASGAGLAGRAAARVAAAVFYVWNPFVAERLLLGQWAMLLGYAGLPWVVAAAVRTAAAARPLGVRGVVRVVPALLPAAAGGFSAMVLSALVGLPAAVLGAREPRRALAAGGAMAAAIAVLSLPWLVPALGSGARADPSAVDLFAPRADTPFGAVGSLLSLGGIWNGYAVPRWYDLPVPAACRLTLSLAAVAGWVRLVRRGEAGGFGVGLSASAACGLLIALAGVTEPGRDALAALIALWPGFGPLRDGHLYVAPLALLQSAGVGGAVLWACTTGAGSEPAARPSRERAGVLVGLGLALLPFVLLPGLLWGAAGRLVAVEYPHEWHRVQRLVNGDPRPGRVLVLPWSAYRGLDWRADGRRVVVLDPATKLFERRAVWNDDLRVDTGGGVRIAEGEDAAARRVERLHAADPGAARYIGALGDLGIRYILVERRAAEGLSGADAETALGPLAGDNRFSSALGGVGTVHDGDRLLLLELPDHHVAPVDDGLTVLEASAWFVTVGAIIGSLAVSGSSLVSRRTGPPPRCGIAEGARHVIKIVAACAIGAALAGGLAFVGTTIATETSSSVEPVNQSLYNYGDR
ncbi:hypothetical protein [Streptomonospora litoralis]|uniref:Uncharacterized protein n=1 Tax=Streptomonospora litoralis TaxID=2498135 RepID=A0A4P6PXH8_9ACTN|nr:hypothetical protein [Streptomonospora litoralis]QBI52783.1 hypothetical protein EKD16_04880 [Streptomonospora litoralis]